MTDEQAGHAYHDVRGEQGFGLHINVIFSTLMSTAHSDRSVALGEFTSYFVPINSYNDSQSLENKQIASVVPVL